MISSITAAMAFVDGVTPTRIWPKTYSGNVEVPRPFTKVEIR